MKHKHHHKRQEWVEGPEFPNDPNQRAAVGDFKDGWNRRSVDTVNNNSDVQKGRQEWVDGPEFPNDPNQRAVNADFKDAQNRRAVDSVTFDNVAQRKR